MSTNDPSCCPCHNYHELKDEDIPLLKKYLDLAQYEESNHNLVNLIMWRDYFPLWINPQEHYLSLIGKHLNKWFMYMPLCEPGYFEEAVVKTEECFRSTNTPFMMSCYTEQNALRALKAIPELEMIEDRDGFDYVYETEKMRTFAGKKLQKKRNHLNAFYKENEGHWVYEDITPDNIPEVKEFLVNWRLDDPDEFLKEEKKGINEVFRLWEVLPCKGGLIRIDGKIVAFEIGSRTSVRMGQSNIEKADPNVRGAYQAILKEFIERHFKDLEYLNREDDMGLESLRHAKEALAPCFMIKKYRLEIKK